MKYIRTANKISPFFYLLLSTLYFEMFFIIITWFFLSIVGLMKNGAIEPPIVFLLRFFSSDFLYAFWVSVPFALSFSLIGLKNAVTEITFNDESREIHLIYHSMTTLFIMKKELRIKYEEFEYYIDKDRHPKIRRFIMPFIPTKVIVFLKDNHFLIQIGNAMDWGFQRFEEVESNLMAIKLPQKTNMI